MQLENMYNRNRTFQAIEHKAQSCESFNDLHLHGLIGAGSKVNGLAAAGRTLTRLGQLVEDGAVGLGTAFLLGRLAAAGLARGASGSEGESMEVDSSRLSVGAAGLVRGLELGDVFAVGGGRRRDGVAVSSGRLCITTTTA